MALGVQRSGQRDADEKDDGTAAAFGGSGIGVREGVGIGAKDGVGTGPLERVYVVSSGSAMTVVPMAVAVRKVRRRMRGLLGDCVMGTGRGGEPPGSGHEGPVPAVGVGRGAVGVTGDEGDELGEAGVGTESSHSVAA